MTGDRWNGEPTTAQKLRWLAENGFFDDREAARLAAALENDPGAPSGGDAHSGGRGDATSDQKRDGPPDESPLGGPSASESSPHDADDTVAELRDRVAALESELADTESQLQAKREEVDDYLRQQEQRLAERRRRVTADLVERLLAEVYEPLGRALTREEPDAETLLEGVELVREQFAATLAADGVEILDPEPGTTLDRNRHTVERTVPAETDEGTVCEVLEPGFTVEGEVVTKARVFVAD